MENTIIIFMTDNGPNGERYNGGMRVSKEVFMKEE
jgi:arylsulfatase A-like enzyme